MFRHVKLIFCPQAGKNSLTDKEKEKLFGNTYSVDQLFDQMDANKDGEVCDFHRGFSIL